MIKNPPVVYARQANVFTGPQRVNNGALAPARETESTPNELLEVNRGERLDTGRRARQDLPQRSPGRASEETMVRFSTLLVAAWLVIGIPVAATAAPCAGFTDVDDISDFCTSIAWMKNRAITLGCTGTQYCPNDFVRRDQMAAFMKRLGESLLPLTCAPGQVMKWNGTDWTCANDDTGSGGGGTVTSVSAGTGLQGSPNPITTTGAINLAPSYQLPQGCTNGQVAKSNGAGGWTCQPDAAGVGTVTSVAAGTGLTGGTITASGTIAADTGYLQRRVSGVCATGSSMRAINADGTVTCETDDAGPANAFVQGGNAFSSSGVLGTLDDQPLDIRVNNQRVMRYEPKSLSPNVVGGNPANSALPGMSGATVAGGGRPGTNCLPDIQSGAMRSCANHAGDLAAIGGGANNAAEGALSVIAGGYGQTTSGQFSTVGGGQYNRATGTYSTIAGGGDNVAGGHGSTVVGGQRNQALGTYSVAMGTRALVTSAGLGSFVFSDASGAGLFGSGQPNEFLVAATGGIGMWTQKDYNTGCRIPAGSGSWTCSSSRDIKRDFEAIDPGAVLSKVVALPITTWRYRTEDGARHLGPTAQDFRTAFGLGSDDVSIASVDGDGVALAAIQGLNAKLEAKDAELAALRREVADLRQLHQKEIAELRIAVEVLMARTSGGGQVAHVR